MRRALDACAIERATDAHLVCLSSDWQREVMRSQKVLQHTCGTGYIERAAIRAGAQTQCYEYHVQFRVVAHAYRSLARR